MKCDRWVGTEPPFTGGSYSGALKHKIFHCEFTFYISSGTHSRPNPDGGRYREEFRSQTLEIKHKDQTVLTLSSIDENPKSGKGRVVYLSAELKEALEAHLKNLTLKSDKLFPEINSSISIGQRFKRILKEVHKKSPLDPKVKVGSHTFRHYCATFMIQKGIGIYDISNHLGHASVETTAIYLHEYQQGEASRRAVAAFQEVEPNKPEQDGSNVIRVNFGGKK